MPMTQHTNYYPMDTSLAIKETLKVRGRPCNTLLTPLKKNIHFFCSSLSEDVRPVSHGSTNVAVTRAAAGSSVLHRGRATAVSVEEGQGS